MRTWSSRVGSPAKASSPISSDTVKPIPPSKATPATSSQLSSSSSSARVSFAVRNVVATMPSALPATRPTTMPRVTRSVSESTSPSRPPIVTPAAKKAKTGTAKPAERGRMRCSNRSAAPWSLSSRPALARTGTVNPSSTPATVACTPDSCTSHQVSAASGSSTQNVCTPRCTATAKPASGSRASPR
ncbi:Uncharacterised protein [Mycobacteroides abscessus subsp. abscessus]|nr:Uncharacterised protein [Mycobacteroides abscessus subsp. abscessus]